MIYTLILKPKYKNLFRGLTVIILLAFSFTLEACYTVNTESCTPGELREKNDFTIKEVKLKNDSTINLDNCEVTYNKSTDSLKSSEDFIKWERKDTIFSNSIPVKVLEIKKSLSELKLTDLKQVTVNSKEQNIELTTGFAIVLAGIIAMLLFTDVFKWHN